jgi:GLPGLI family protein
MKIKTLAIVLFSAILILSNAVFGQKSKEAKPFSGEINYAISFEGGTISESEKLFLPTEHILSVSGTKQHSLTKMQMGNQGEFSDSQTKNVTALIDFQGNKMAITSTPEETQKSINPIPADQIKVIEETKEIAGYKCKKAEVTMGEDVFVVYFTDEIVVPDCNWKSPFAEIKGMLLEYTMPVPGTEMTMKFVAKSVKKKKISDDLFTIPKDFKVMTSEEAATMFGQ